MPFDLSVHLKSAGDTVTGADLDSLFNAALAIHGASGAAHGVQDSDVPQDAGIPVAALNYRTNVQVLQIESHESSSITGHFPPTALIMPFAGVFTAWNYGHTAGAVFALYRNGKCFDTLSVGLTTNRATVDAVGERFEIGDTLSWRILAAGQPEPAIGSDQTDERMDAGCSLHLWFEVED